MIVVKEADGILLDYLQFEAMHGELGDVMGLERRRHVVQRQADKIDNAEELPNKSALLSDLVVSYGSEEQQDTVFLDHCTHTTVLLPLYSSLCLPLSC